MQLTGTAWVKSRITRDDGRCKTYRSRQKHESLSLHDLPTGRHLLGDPFLTRLNWNACTALTTQNSTDSNCVISHVRNTTDIQPSVLLIGIFRLLGISNRLGFPQRKPLPRSPANSTVVNCSAVVLDHMQQTRQGWVSQSLFSRHWNLVPRRSTSRDNATVHDTCSALLNSPHSHRIKSTTHPWRWL